MDKHIGKEGAAVIVLSLMLTVVFALSVWMYDGIESEMSDGTLSGAAEAVRTFMNENEAIAAFLGMDPEEPAATEAHFGENARRLLRLRRNILRVITEFTGSFGDVCAD